MKRFAIFLFAMVLVLLAVPVAEASPRLRRAFFVVEREPVRVFVPVRERVFVPAASVYRFRDVDDVREFIEVDRYGRRLLVSVDRFGSRLSVRFVD